MMIFDGLTANLRHKNPVKISRFAKLADHCTGCTRTLVVSYTLRVSNAAATTEPSTPAVE